LKYMRRSDARNQRIRASTVEGIFYPQDPERLRGEVQRLLDQSTASSGRAQSIIVPHAAYAYSGKVAAAAFKASAGRRIELAVLLGPVHREPEGGVLLSESQAYQTPLGVVQIDQKSVQELANHDPEFRYDEIPHLEEHCLEVQLPFLQVLHPGAKILPLLLGRPSRKRIESLAEVLEDAACQRRQSVLFVASSNMSTFHDSAGSEAETEEVLGRIRDMDWEALVEGSGGKRLSTCGAGCIAAILLLHRRIGGSAVVLERASSLAAGGDPKRVVQYAAVALSVNES
jgi:AmmeMemoRadiSam system protein B